MAKYSIGIDFGTQSARAILLNLETGEEVAVAIKEYTHGVMDEALPDGTPLGVDWALQHPQDYLEVLQTTIPELLKKAQISNDDVVGIGIDFTSCTIMPIYADGTPLCFVDQFKNRPHTYPKLWKHHAAQEYANRLNSIAHERGEKFLQRYGGKISSEWAIPKIWQVLEEDEAIYDEMDRFIEATDWIVMQLTGKETRNSCTAGYKAIWSKREGFPSNDFFKALHPKLEHVIDNKFSRDILPIGSKAGEIDERGARLTGLKVGTAVAVGNVDAHVSLPAVGITEPGKMLMIIGTSTCHMLLGEKEEMVPGICGVVEDGILPGYFGYEAGQSCVGDHFEWMVKNCISMDYQKEAEKLGISIHELLTEKAGQLRVGESGLIALDWWNGNRSVLVDADLTGLLIGATLQTKPEEIYRALIEATAYGTRMIIETFNDHGIPVKELYAAGGIAEKNALMMQIYADVTNMEIRISGSPQAPALGSAMYGAVAAGKEKSGFSSIFEIAKKFGKIKDRVYRPIPENVKVYNQLYSEYKILHDYFGRGGNDVMKRLKRIKQGA